ncbi:hypothetical protein SBBP1_1110002 [Burkholderiales bacterium]|nr:hypothetical protein SBBP1_1110002 [Burkholderiales bacterium]
MEDGDQLTLTQSANNVESPIPAPAVTARPAVPAGAHD